MLLQTLHYPYFITEGEYSSGVDGCSLVGGIPNADTQTMEYNINTVYVSTAALASISAKINSPLLCCWVVSLQHLLKQRVEVGGLPPHSSLLDLKGERLLGYVC